MTPEQQIISDIGRKCADDVSQAIRRNFQLVEGSEAALVIASYAAVSAFGAAGGAFAAHTDGPPTLDEATIDALWQGYIRPMLTGDFVREAKHGR